MIDPHRPSSEHSRRDARLAVVASPVTAVGWILAAVVLGTLPWQLIGVGLFFLGLWLTARTNRGHQLRGLRWLPRHLRELASAAGWSTTAVTTVFASSMLALLIGLVVLVQRMFST